MHLPVTALYTIEVLIGKPEAASGTYGESVVVQEVFPRFAVIVVVFTGACAAGSFFMQKR